MVFKDFLLWLSGENGSFEVINRIISRCGTLCPGDSRFRLAFLVDRGFFSLATKLLEVTIAREVLPYD